MAKKDGYDLCDEMFEKIGSTKNHEIPIEDMIEVISFWGYNEEADMARSKFGFVCYCAREKLKKVIEQALVYDDYSMFDDFVRLVKEHRQKRENEVAENYPKFDLERAKNYDAEYQKLIS